MKYIMVECRWCVAVLGGDDYDYASSKDCLKKIVKEMLTMTLFFPYNPKTRWRKLQFWQFWKIWENLRRLCRGAIFEDPKNRWKKLQVTISKKKLRNLRRWGWGAIFQWPHRIHSSSTAPNPSISDKKKTRKTNILYKPFRNSMEIFFINITG